MNHSRIRFSGLLLLLLLAFTVSLVSAQGLAEVAREDTVILDIDGGASTNRAPFSHNQLFGGTSAGGNVGTGQVVYDPLFVLNYESGEVEPWIGESMTPSDDFMTWTLKIREGAWWADGETLDADDVVWTVNLLLNDDTRRLARAAAIQGWTESVEKIDDLTVQFNLSKPNPRYQLDYYSVKIGGSFLPMPEHHWSQIDDVFAYANFDLENGHPLGSGPYKMVSASENEFIYDRDDNWWGAASGYFPLPEPKRLIWVHTGNDDVRSLLAIDNQLDSVMDITVGAYDVIRAQNPNFVTWTEDLPYVWFGPCARRITINHTVDPWGDPDMRWVLSHATDRSEVVRIAYEGVSVPSRTNFPEYGGLQVFINALEEAGLTQSPVADVAAAQAILEGKGYALNDAGIYEKDGQELGIEIQAHEGFIEKRRIAENLVEQWRGAGIAATQVNVAGGTWSDNKALGNFEATGDWDQCASINEPWAGMDRDNVAWYAPIGERAPGGNNFARWSGEKAEAYSAIVDQMGVLPLGDEAIMPMFMEAMGIWYEELPTLPITQATKLIPFNETYWVGWPTAENNYFHAPTWWHSTSKIILNLQKAG